MRRSLHYRGRGFNTRRLDAGGKRRQQQRSHEAARAEEIAFREQLEENRVRDERVQEITRSGRLPALLTLGEVKDTAESTQPDFAVYQVVEGFPLDAVKKAVFGKSGYNRRAVRSTTENLPPHFDHYFEDFSPWLLHVNRRGQGVVRGAFLDEKTYDGYRKIIEVSDLSDPIIGEMLSEQRIALAALQLAAGKTHMLEGPIKPGTMTLLWNGKAERRFLRDGFDLVPPSIHQIERDDATGAYTIYARQERGDYIPEGFVEV